jgi:DNA end-binding protein Ku
MATVGTRKKKSRPRSKFRASWRGQLRFGLVSFEVQAVNAANKEQAEVHFHLLHALDHERIHYAKMCPKHGEVPNKEIVEGYEYAKGHYIEFSKEELDALRSEREKALVIDAFIAPDEIDPIYFDGRMYYLIPSGAVAAEPYALVAAAMQRKRRWGIAQVVFSGRQQLALVRPIDGVLSMAMLNYDAEIRKPAEIKSEFTKAETTPRKLKLAEELIGEWHEKRFEFSHYKDRYREKVIKAIEAKRKGRELPELEEEEPAVINLMDALRQSIARSNGRHADPPRRTKPSGNRTQDRRHRRRRPA